MDVPCIFCQRVVNRWMHAVSCDNCHGWQHIKCNTGISSAEYKLMVTNQIQCKWFCGPCCSVHQQLPARVSADAEEAVADEVRPQEEEVVSMVSEPNQILDTSFDIDNGDIEHPEPTLDRSVPDPVVDDVDIDEFTTVTYTEVQGATKKGGRKLASSDGFTYTVKREKRDFIYWRCTVRGKKPACQAVIRQYGDVYIRGPQQHNHPADPGARVKAEVLSRAKQVAKEQVLRPAADIAEAVMKDVRQPSDHGLPKIDNLTRYINRCRGKLRPKDTVLLYTAKLQVCELLES